MEKLVVFEKLFFDKLILVIPSAQSSSPGQKKTIFVSCSMFLLAAMYYALCLYPGILSICFSMHNIHLTITNSHLDVESPKIILSWLLFGIGENLRIVLDRMPLMRLATHMGSIYVIGISPDTNKQILLKISNKSKEALQQLCGTPVAPPATAQTESKK